MSIFYEPEVEGPISLDEDDYADIISKINEL